MRKFPAMPSARLMLSLAAAALLPAPPAAAIGQLADISIIDRASGRSLPVYRHAGQWWVAGRPGARYAVSIRNQSGGRILAVTAVDGVNAVSGETAAWQQTGYVLEGWQRHDVAGWRKSDAEIAAFEFTALENAYASRTGRPTHVGVIGVALFRERVDVMPQRVAPVPVAPAARHEKPEAMREAQGAAAPGPQAPESPAPPPPASAAASSASAASPPSTAAPNDSERSGDAPQSGAPAATAGAEARSRAAAPGTITAPMPQARRDLRLGTGHGPREISQVVRTRFERLRSEPDEIISLRYDSYDNLIAMSVIRFPSKPPGLVPDAFPASARTGYVPDPPLP